MSKTHATAPACQIVRRTRTELSMVFLCGCTGCDGARGSFGLLRKNVARAAPRMEQRLVGRRVDLSADAIDVDLNQVLERVKFFGPDLLLNFDASDDTYLLA